MPGHTAAIRSRGTLSRPCRDVLTCGFSPGWCNSRELSYRIVVLGSAWEAASCTSRNGTPASSAAVMNACRSVCGVTGLVIPVRRAARRTIRPAPCRSSRRPSSGQEHGTVGALADGQVDRPGGARCQRNGNDLAALAGDGHRPVTALQAQVPDIRAGRLGHAQAVQGEQRDQRVLTRRAEPGGDQQRAELVAVQGGGMRLIVHPRTADMGGRGMIQELFFDGVLVEPRDGGQPASDGSASTAPGFQLAGEPFDVGAADREQGQGTGAAPAGELAQVQGVGLAGQAAVPGQVPGERESFGVGEGWLDGTRAAVVIGVPPGRAETRELGQQRAPAIERKPTVCFATRSRQVTVRRTELEPGRRRDARDRRIGARKAAFLGKLLRGYRSLSSA